MVIVPELEFQDELVFLCLDGPGEDGVVDLVKLTKPNLIICTNGIIYKRNYYQLLLIYYYKLFKYESKIKTD